MKNDRQKCVTNFVINLGAWSESFWQAPDFTFFCDFGEQDPENQNANDGIYHFLLLRFDVKQSINNALGFSENNL